MAESFFSAYGAYPRGETPGLRVFLAKPEYICAMKLKALQRESVGEKDFEAAARLPEIAEAVRSRRQS